MTPSHSELSGLPPVVCLDEIDSTNDEARRRAEAGARGPLWLTAERQSSGRGRYGRSWLSLSGNLAATYLFQPGLPAEACAHVSFVAALAVADAVDRFLPGSARVKWPNDVLVDGRKLAGILLEAGGAEDDGRPAWLAVGFGVNLAAAPDDVPFPAIALASLCEPPSPRAFLDTLRMTWREKMTGYEQQGFGPTRDGWLARAYGLGQPIHVKLAEQQLRGIFEGLDAEGVLLVREGAQLHRIRAGEVFFV